MIRCERAFHRQEIRFQRTERLEFEEFHELVKVSKIEPISE